MACLFHVALGVSRCVAGESGAQADAQSKGVQPAPQETSDAESLPPLVSDRPDFTESTQTVPSGWLQLEGGYTFTYDREGDQRRREHTAPEFLLRAGCAENLELRLGWNGYTWSEQHDQIQRRSGRRVGHDDWLQGASDVTFGVKTKFFDQAGLRPDFGVIVQATAPTGSDGFTSGDVDPEVKLLWAYELPYGLSVAGNMNLGVPTQDAHRFVQASASVSLGVGLSDRLGAYTEYFGFYPNADGADCAHYVNGGLTYLLCENLQLDVRMGAGLNEEADDFFAGMGFAWRFGT